MRSKMPTCAAKGCSNSSWKNKRKMCYFPIKEPVRCTIWIKKLNRENWIPSKHSALCEEHFASDMWEKERIDGLLKLKRNAIPTLFGNEANLDDQGEVSSSDFQNKDAAETLTYSYNNENDVQYVEDEFTSEKSIINDEATNDVRINVENELENDMDTNNKSIRDIDSSYKDVKLKDNEISKEEVPNSHDNLNICNNCFNCEKKMKEIQKRYTKLLNVQRRTQRKLISANYEIKRQQEKVRIIPEKTIDKISNMDQIKLLTGEF